MLSHVVDLLADPIDGSLLAGADNFARLVSESGHSYDVAKQGYVTLASGAGLHHDGDSLAMVRAREAYLSRGYFSPFVEAVTDAVADTIDSAELAEDSHPALLEVGAGTGFYLAHSLDSIEGARGIGLDISVHAAKQLAKAHDRLGAVVADVWKRLPIKDGSIDAISVVFAPRNFAEFQRVLSPRGEVTILAPKVGHLDELRKPLGIIGVEEDKAERLYDQSRGFLTPSADPKDIEFPIVLDRESIREQVEMSPSARHITPEELTQKLESFPDTMEITARASLYKFSRA